MGVKDSRGRDMVVQVRVNGRWHTVTEIHQDGATGLGYETEDGSLLRSSEVDMIKSWLVDPPKFWRQKDGHNGIE